MQNNLHICHEIATFSRYQHFRFIAKHHLLSVGWENGKKSDLLLTNHYPSLFLNFQNSCEMTINPKAINQKIIIFFSETMSRQWKWRKYGEVVVKFDCDDNLVGICTFGLPNFATK